MLESPINGDTAPAPSPSRITPSAAASHVAHGFGQGLGQLDVEIGQEGVNEVDSAPSTTPDTGKIAVKVINHYGDEVLKVFGV